VCDNEEAAVLNFEHLIQINDPLNPLMQDMTRDQLWEGLVLRAEQPQLFVLGLDSCTILSRTESTLERELQPKESVRYDIMATSAHVGGSLTMTIEQPDPVQLFLRFQYQTTLPTTDEKPADNDVRQTQEIVKSAYRESDIDTVRLIREYVLGLNAPDQLH
jgi:hypothetical protein